MPLWVLSFRGISRIQFCLSTVNRTSTHGMECCMHILALFGDLKCFPSQHCLCTWVPNTKGICTVLGWYGVFGGEALWGICFGVSSWQRRVVCSEHKDANGDHSQSQADSGSLPKRPSKKVTFKIKLGGASVKWCWCGIAVQGFSGWYSFCGEGHIPVVGCGSTVRSVDIFGLR